MGVWHTAIVVGGVEYYYGGGVQQAPAGCTPFGQPQDVILLGYADRSLYWLSISLSGC